ncbi:hypothetical protein Selin_0738 [Desulfurispirillum indicum S5]|uniref:Uncharacterized protein n=1 Tax=Desulfurispirillum indicum (strain ATCC BAA-1389 / DSM 22839 / S5) TaxID=653733 RepID=E6W1V0_DESIS|nr:hypothetical protein [Desulfurispirillum indicum]ADU65482.1 hypothetical protein Selin_0738 [Desulfurispirillum indicum S5]
MFHSPVFLSVMILALCFFFVVVLYLLWAFGKMRQSMGHYSLYELESLHDSLEALLIKADESTLNLTDEIKKQEFILKQLLDLVDKRKAELEALIQQSDDVQQAARTPKTEDIKEDVAFYMQRGFTPQEIAKKLGKTVSEVTLLCRVLESQQATGNSGKEG